MRHPTLILTIVFCHRSHQVTNRVGAEKSATCNIECIARRPASTGIFFAQLQSCYQFPPDLKK